MDAVKFIEERNRMCDRYWQADGDCDGCPLVDAVECNELRNMIDNTGKVVGNAVEIVEKWSQEHPRKTRQDAFLEQYPTARVTDDGALGILPCLLDETLFAHCRHADCDDCRREFWMQEAE